MSQSSGSDLYDFTELRDFLEKEIEKHMQLQGRSLSEAIPVTMERGETRFFFSPPGNISKSMILDALGLLRNHTEGIFLHSFEQGFIVFQALGEDIHRLVGRPLESVIDRIKFKFITIGNTAKVEVVKKGNFTILEAHAAAELFRFFHRTEIVTGPEETLRALGASVHEVKVGGVPVEEIAGYESTKREIEETVILPLLHPEVFQSVSKLTRKTGGSNTPKAVLFAGPPGVGKTTMARAISARTGIPLVYVPVENILSKYYGESAQNLAALFDAAARYERVILFLDEIDSLAGSRDEGLYEATRRVLSVLLRKIDSMETKEGVLTIGATNRSQDLDGALLSRFDHIVEFPLPAITERSAIFGRYANHLDGNELAELGRLSDGLSGRNIQDICEYAERRWARDLIQTGSDPSAPPARLYREITEARPRNS